MEYRTLGKTGEKISAIGMGSWNIGVSGGSAEQREIKALQHGMDLGINLIDTAEMYGDGSAERLVGEAIRGRRESAFVATKVSPSHLRHRDVLAACDRSLQRLGIEQIDLYQVHWPNPRIPIKETMDAMGELVREGKVRHVGVSNFSVEQTREAQKAIANIEIVSNQVEYSLMNRQIEDDVLPHCQAEGMTVIAYRPLAYGNLPTQGLPRSILDKYHITAAQLMLNWVTRHEKVVAIPKSASLDHMEENANSLSTKLSEDEYRMVSESTG